MPDQPPSGAPATSSPPAPVTPLTPVVAALIGGLVLVIVGAFVVLVAVGADPSTFVLLIGAPILTAVVGVLNVRQVHAVEERARVIQEQTNGALTAQIDGVHEHIRLESQALRRMASRPPQEPAGSSLPSQRQSAVR
jgi:hypothetical protein